MIRRVTFLRFVVVLSFQLSKVGKRTNFEISHSFVVDIFEERVDGKIIVDTSFVTEVLSGDQVRLSPGGVETCVARATGRREVSDGWKEKRV